jgi:phosphate starvation-inducible PhoH-like protein
MGSKARQRTRGAEVNDLAPHSFVDAQARKDYRPRKQLQPLKPLNDTQARYIQTIAAKTMVFGLGPAGTGKTYIATRTAAEMFRDKHIEKIVISRPAVEAGESIGFLPGDMGEKIDPYFAPVKEVLVEVLGAGPLEYAMKSGQIEFVPIGFMRGRTFKNAFVIIDEAQNVTKLQMKMALSRIGEGSTYVVNGDVMQSDIGYDNGLRDARRRLINIPGISFITFRRSDIVRHDLVREIIDAYEGTDEDDEFQPGLPGFITNPVDAR